MRLLLSIHSLTVLGFFGSAGLNQEPSHDFDSSFFGVTAGIRGTAYCGAGGFFGGDFFSESASPTLPQKFFVPPAILSQVDGALLAALGGGRFGLATVLLSELNGHNDQAIHTAGRALVDRTIATASKRILPLRASMTGTH
jgi:hypothetical protein